MNLSKSIILGMIGVFLQDGIDIAKFDEQNNTIYLIMPEDGYLYHREGISSELDTPQKYAKRLQDKIRELTHSNIKVKYKTKQGYFTKEDGEKNYKSNIHNYKEIL